MERVKLVQVQVDYIKEMIVTLSDRLDQYREENKLNYEGRTVTTGASTENFAHSLKEDIVMVKKEIIKLTDVLANHELVEEPDSDVIEIGSRFKVLFDGEEEEFIFLETAEYLPNYQDNFVSKDSILGRMLLGATVGDRIEYKVNKQPHVAVITQLVKGQVK